MMQHAADVHVSASYATEPAQQDQQPSAMITDTTSRSSTSSPKSQKPSLDPNLSQVSESTLASLPAHELTPPSSVASTQEQHDVERQLIEESRVGNMSSPSTVTGRKRTASGEVKGTGKAENAASIGDAGHVQHASTVSQMKRASLGELSQQLRTKLSYAMVKVQHGWQKHSLDEIESIASQSPRSNFSGHGQREFQSMVSPRTAIANSKRHNSGSSISSGQSLRHVTSSIPVHVAAASPSPSSPRKTLAPPAPIISGARRKPTPNVSLHINSSLRSPPKPTRPTATQRTPSQNAAMEADAVETLLFMSASPSNSAHFPSHLSTYSPTSQVFSAQASPLKTQFSPSDRMSTRGALGYSPRSTHRRVRYEDKTALIDRLLSELDEDESEELDRAVKIMEQHHAAKLST